MTKADVVSEIAKSTGIDRGRVLQVVEAFMESVKETMVGVAQMTAEDVERLMKFEGIVRNRLK